jgi:pseudouridine kinase
MESRIRPFSAITVFGGATIDRIAVSAAPPILGVSNPGSARTNSGGVGLNVAFSLARLGHKVRLVARVGADTDGEMIITAAAAAGADAGGISVSPVASTAGYYGAFDDRGGLIIGIADMGIYDEMLPAVVAPAIAGAAADDFWLVDANLPAETLDFLVGEAAQSGRQIGALTVSPAKAVRLQPLLDRLTLLFANRREAAALLDLPWSGHGPPAAELAAEISRNLTPNVVVTNSSDPLAAASHGEVRSLAPLRASIRSVNGAGDALAAGTVHGLALGRTLFEAVLSGLAAAAITVESETTVSPLLTPAAIAERIGAGGKHQNP